MSAVTRIGKQLVAHWSDRHSCLCSRDHWVYRYDYQSGRLSELCRLPPAHDTLAGRLKDALARSRFYQWLRPAAGLSHLVPLANGDLLMLYDRFYHYKAGQAGKQASVIAAQFSPKLATPLRGGIAVHALSQCAYYGEYLNGHSRDIRVVRVNAARQQVEVCWTFKRSEIKHVHAVHYDPFRNRLWVLTGDTDHESAIFYTDDEFVTLHQLGGGDQRWRAIAMWFSQDFVEWGMDAGQDAPADCLNKIYRYRFEDSSLTEMANVGNPVYAACTLADGQVIVATTFEPKRTQATPPTAQLWRRDLNGEWSELTSFGYQRSARQGISSYGMVYLPKGELPAGQLVYTPVNSQTDDYQTCLLPLPAAGVRR